MVPCVPGQPLTSQTTDSIYRRLYYAKGSWTGSTN